MTRCRIRDARSSSCTECNPCSAQRLINRQSIDPRRRALADIVEIKHIMLPPSPREFKDIYVVFELMETDLHQVTHLRSMSGLHTVAAASWEMQAAVQRGLPAEPLRKHRVIRLQSAIHWLLPDGIKCRLRGGTFVVSEPSVCMLYCLNPSARGSVVG